LTQAAVETLPTGKYVEARVEVFPFGHVFRKGSRIRVIVDAPGASRPTWGFDAFPKIGNQVNTIGWGGDTLSRIVLPVVPGVKVAAGLPACPGLRAQPCRRLAPITNGS
jgi:predicted acyl esterase